MFPAVPCYFVFVPPPPPHYPLPPLIVRYIHLLTFFGVVVITEHSNVCCRPNDVQIVSAAVRRRKWG